MKEMLAEVAILFAYPKHLLILALRFLLAYGFTTPALLKINDVADTAEWFESINIPLPLFTAYLVSAIETMGIVLLILGLFTRYISILLTFVMLGAIYFVHLVNGFSAANDGFEIPLYYLIFLMLLAGFGAGKYSLDNLIFKDGNHE